MTENLAAAPYIIQINEPILHLSDELVPDTRELTLPSPQMFVDSTEAPIEIVQESTKPISHNYSMVEELPCIVQIVYPHDLCLSPAQNIAKRGRPKKKKQKEIQGDDVLIKTENQQCEVSVNPAKLPRTRSGRLVKLPKHMEKNFKKIEVATEEQEVQVSDFPKFEEKENSKIQFAELQTKKRVISPQYKCPKCHKAYLGKNKMNQHLKKYPDHGPLPEGCQEFNFDVWNYLFDITQKCRAGQRGIKFCEELSNLLHNVQLLKSALFKTVTDNKNCVHIDKVLGNAIGLPPGRYKFDENELYKDVTVLKLITNNDFFVPNKQVPEDEDGDKIDENCTVISDDVKNDAGLRIEEPDGDTKGPKTDQNAYSFAPKPPEPPSKVPENAIAETFSKKIDLDNQMLPSDLLLLQSLPNPRNSVDDLMLTGVDNGSTLLDNSTSSDEVMNVDQFVNERFKKIIGPDIELANASLNLDLPSLELFQFHTS